MPTLEQLINALHRSWTPGTAYNPDEWSEASPARGQCVVSSLVVQDYLGGDLQRYEVEGDGFKETHYANILPGGIILDTTASQYNEGTRLMLTPVDLKGLPSVRAKRLADVDTRRRYELLKSRVDVILQERAA